MPRRSICRRHFSAGTCYTPYYHMFFESPATTFRLVNHICLSTVTYVAKGAPQEFCVVTAREGIRARIDGKILGTPVILTYIS